MTGSWPWWKWMLVGCGAAATLCLTSSVVLLLVVTRSVARTNAEFERIGRLAVVGTPVATLVDDEFLEHCEALELSGAVTTKVSHAPGSAGPCREAVARVRGIEALRRGSGNLEVMWVYLPPFGRHFLRVRFEDGAITEARTSSLD